MSTSDEDSQVLSLPAALFRHAAERPAEPWLFFREGWDWRWSSWEEVARRVEAWSAALSSLPAGTRAAFADLPRPRALAIDLALQAAGLIAVPIAGAVLPEELSRRGCRGWVEVEGDAAPDAGDIDLPRVTLSAARLPAARPSRPTEEAGGAVAVDAAGAVRELTAADLAGAYGDIQNRLGAPQGREIVVSCRPLEELRERRLLSWATVAGAAVLLEPDSGDMGSLAATAAWARPTLLSAGAAEAQALRRAAEADRPSLASRLLRRRRQAPSLPFGRLRVLLVPPGGLPAGEASFWEGRGVRLVAGGMV